MKLVKCMLFLVSMYCYSNSHAMCMDQYFINQLLEANFLFEKSKQTINGLGRELMTCSSKNYYDDSITANISASHFSFMAQRVDRLNAFAAQAILLASSVCNDRNANLIIKCRASLLLQEIRTFTDAGLINVIFNH